MTDDKEKEGEGDGAGEAAAAAAVPAGGLTALLPQLHCKLHMHHHSQPSLPPQLLQTHLNRQQQQQQWSCRCCLFVNGVASAAAEMLRRHQCTRMHPANSLAAAGATTPASWPAAAAAAMGGWGLAEPAAGWRRVGGGGLGRLLAPLFVDAGPQAPTLLLVKCGLHWFACGRWLCRAVLLQHLT